MDYNVFISWSKPRGAKLAEGFREFLANVVQSAKPFMSEEDLAKGGLWPERLIKVLETIKIGVICVTPESAKSPWLLFEAGMLTRSVESLCVCPYLLGMTKDELKPPLSLLNATSADEHDTLKLVRTLNKALGAPLDAERLQTAFNHNWPKFGSLIEEQKSAGNSDDTSPQELKERLQEWVTWVLKKRKEHATAVGLHKEMIATELEIYGERPLELRDQLLSMGIKVPINLDEFEKVVPDDQPTSALQDKPS